VSAPGGTASFHQVRRRFAACWTTGALAGDDGAPSLERQQALPGDPPRLRGCPPLEGHAVRAVRVPAPAAGADERDAGFAAFLDGTQQTRPIGYPEGLPVVFGTVAAVIRARRNRRMVTWGPGRASSGACTRRSPCCSPRAAPTCAAAVADLCRRGARRHLAARPPRRGAVAAPRGARRARLGMVKEDRERVEKHVAELWCGRAEGALFVDGGIQESELVARASCVVGVVKSHRTLYAEGDALRTVLGLGAGSARRRSSSRHGRAPHAGGELVPAAARARRARPDVGAGAARGGDARRRGGAGHARPSGSDRLSRWVLAEIAPVALPDGRWDRLAYGVYDCEQFLRAVC
jgi:hypothetical protein